MDVTCIDCKRPMRSRRHHAEDYPGTVAHNGQGLCLACYARAKRAGKLTKAPQRGPQRFTRPAVELTTCEGHGCTKTLRPHGARAEDYPGTAARKSRGRCSTCYEQLYTAKSKATPESVARTAEALTAYLAWRKPFRAKAGAL